jgi:hypothetical protein
MRPSIHPSIHPLILSFVRSFIPSFMSFIYSFFRSFILLSFAQSCIMLFIPSLILLHACMHSFIHPSKQSYKLFSSTNSCQTGFF